MMLDIYQISIFYSYCMLFLVGINILADPFCESLDVAVHAREIRILFDAIP